jgi:hypothetical protein
MLNGVPQKPIEGVSMVYTFDDASAPSRRRTQYFKMLENRAIDHDGWIASTTPPLAPWVVGGKKPDVDDYKWELYHIAEDFSQAVNLADREPATLRELQDFLWIEAAKYDVLPLDNSTVERFGVQYTTPMSITYNNIVESVQGLGPGLRTIFLAVGGLIGVPAGSQVDLTLTMPQQVMASVYHQFNDKLAVMGNFGWQNWSAFGEPSVVVRGDPSNLRFTADQGYTDTFHTAIGAHYQLTDRWRLMAGFAYDSSAVSTSKRPRSRSTSSSGGASAFSGR